MKKEVVLLIGAGQISMAIARRVSSGKKIIVGDWNLRNAQNISNISDNLKK